MIHRHLSYRATTPVEALPSAALVDLLDRGDLEAWKPLVAALRLDPHGPLADRLLNLLDAYPMYGTSSLWRAWIERCRIRAEGRLVQQPLAVDLAALRRSAGLTQAALADRAGMTQSDLSKLERRADVRFSSLRAYARALGGRVEAVFQRGDRRVEIRIGEGAEARSASGSQRAPRRSRRAKNA